MKGGHGGSTGSSVSGGNTTGAGSASGSGDLPAASNEPVAPPAPNLDYTKESTNLVLDYLRNQKEQTNPDLLNRLGWTPEQLKEFTERWEKTRQLENSNDPLARRRFQEELESLGMRPPEPQRTEKQRDINDAQRGLQDSGNRAPPPIRFRDAFDSYRRSIAK